jgi:hypothetical protein
MSLPTPRSREAPPATPYTYRRQLGVRELLPAVGAAVGAGLVAFYVAAVFLQRTPLDISGTRRDHLSRGPTGE